LDLQENPGLISAPWGPGQRRRCIPTWLVWWRTADKNQPRWMISSGA